MVFTAKISYVELHFKKVNRLLTLYKIIKMIFITHFDSPALWQTYLSDPASITMEGILIFNKHLLFLLTVIVVFVGWLLFYTIHYFIEYNNKFSSKFVHSKELEIV
jgi:heme/copper-type cytochrome/quinol oxidase subunit 2